MPVQKNKINQQDRELFLVYDPAIPTQKNEIQAFLQDVNYTLLFENTMLAEYKQQSPIVAKINDNSALIDFFMRDDKPCDALFINSNLTCDAMAQHLRTFLFRKRYDDLDMLIRFYDPFVFHDRETYFSADMLHDFFVPIQRVVYTAPDRCVYIATEEGNTFIKG